MRILMMSYEFPPLGGGGAKVVRGLAEQLVRVGHEVDVLTMQYRDLPPEERVAGIRVFRVPCVRLRESLCTTPEMLSYDLSALLSLRFPQLGQYDLNHTHFLYPDGLVSMLARRFSGLPYVVTAHGSDVPDYNPNRFRLLHRLLAPLWRRIAGQASCVVCPSESLRSLVLRHGRKTHTTVIPNGFDVDRLSPARHKAKRILVVSRLFERKGVQYLIEAVEGLESEFEVHVVGDGPHASQLRRLAARKKAPVRFHGWLDNDDPLLRDLYETSRIFVLPSEAENFPIVLLEAMAAGMAIVTTSGTGCAEVVGEAAELVPPRSAASIRAALCRLMTQPELCARLGGAARRRVEQNFSWAAVAERYTRLYRTHAQRN